MDPVSHWMPPTSAMIPIAARNRYTGTANRRGRRPPRTFTRVTSATIAVAMTSSCPRRVGMIVTRYCVPEESDTATVST